MSIINRDQILTMIPHAGAMCLLDAVLHWDDTSVRCLSRRYRNPDNPMRRADGTLGTACGVEIAAQAMAVHGRLSAGDTAKQSSGALASLRDIRIHTAHLDALEDDLIITAERLMGDAKNASYRFVLSTQGIELLSGRAMVLLSVSQ